MTLGNTITSANLMTDESLGILKENKRLSKDDTDNLECTIKVRQSTIDLLKEVAYRYNFGTYNSAIVRLVTFYNKHVDKELMH